MDKKKMFRSNIDTRGGGLSLSEIRSLALNQPAEFVRKIQDGAESGKLTFEGMRDMKGLFNALVDVPVPVVMEYMGAQRSIQASAFPILTGTLAIAAINAAYAALPTIGERLVTEMEDSKKVTTMAAVHSLDNQVDEVKELQDFPEIGTDEEKVEIRHRKNGRKLTISAEAISENEIPDIVSRINALGKIAGTWVEKQTIRRICDYDGSKSVAAEPYVYRPAGTGTAIYSSTANTPGPRAPSGTRIDNNALVDETDLDAARTRLVSFVDNSGEHIAHDWSSVSLLLPEALIGTAMKIFNSEMVPGVVNEYSNWGPRGRWNLPTDRILSSARLDDLSTSAWYMGDFAGQFTRKWKLRFEYVTLGTDTQAYLDSQVAFQARIAWDVEVGARDYVSVVQCLSGTTAPADE